MDGLPASRQGESDMRSLNADTRTMRSWKDRLPGIAPSGQAGFTLVELMVSLVLTSIMFSAMLIVFQSQTRINTIESDVIEAQQNARMGMTSLAQDIRQAGYFVDHFNRQPIWLDAAPYQLVFNANISDQFVAMHRDSAVPLSSGTMYTPGSFTSPPQEENLPGFLDRYLNESETIRLTLDRTYDGQVTVADRQEGAANPHLYTLTKEINGNPPAVLAYNVRGDDTYPDGSTPPPLFQYWGTFTFEGVLELWGDVDGDGFLSPGEIAVLTAVPVANLSDIQQVDVTMIVESNRIDRAYEGSGSSSSENYPYRSYTLRQRIRARNVGINTMGLVLCGDPPGSPVNPVGYDTPDDDGGDITIEWDSSPDEYSGEDDVQFYTIYRAISGSDYSVVGQIQAMGLDTTYHYQDDGDIDNFDAPVDGSEYYYYIAAWDCAPQESIPSPVIGPIVSVANGPSPPFIEDAWDTPCDGGDDITVFFTASPQDDGSETGVSLYNIYRGTTADTSIIFKIQVDTLEATGASQYEYHDTVSNAAGLPPEDGTNYYYIIRAVMGGVESDNSNEFGAVWSSEGLSAARLTSIDDKPADSGEALIVNWRRSPSEDCSPAPAEYELYRRMKGSATWGKVADIPVTFSPYYSIEDNNSGSGLISGTTYEYVVLVRTTGDPEESNIMEGTPRDNPPVGPPSNLIAEDVPCEPDGDISIAWARSPDDGAGAYTADLYYLYRRVEGGLWSKIETFTADGSLRYAWVDSDSSNPGFPPVLGNTYWYKVTAWDEATLSESTPSNEDDAFSDSSPGAPEITAAYDTYGSGSREIKVEFLASDDDGGCSDSVTRYHIYRTTTPGAYGGHIGTVTATDAVSYSWRDNLLNSIAPPIEGFTYYYVIRAYDAINDIESRDSNEFGPVEPYGQSCECCPIFVDDMEIGNLGWTHGGTKDDWELGTPGGKGFDPSLAHSGGNVWGTDLGIGAGNGLYQVNTASWLTSPSLDFSGFSEGYVIMQYWRWLTVESSQKDKAQVLVNDGTGWEMIWQNTQNDNTVDTEWKKQFIDLSRKARGAHDFRVMFYLETDNRTQFGGWNIDDVEVCYTAATPCDYFDYDGPSVTTTQGNNLFFDIYSLATVPVDMLGMEISWSAPGSLLKRVKVDGYNWNWIADTSQPSGVELYFDTPVAFPAFVGDPLDPGDVAAADRIGFQLQFQPGQMRGAAITLRFITACGKSTEIVMQVPE